MAVIHLLSAGKKTAKIFSPLILYHLTCITAYIKFHKRPQFGIELSGLVTCISHIILAFRNIIETSFFCRLGGTLMKDNSKNANPNECLHFLGVFFYAYYVF